MYEQIIYCIYHTSCTDTSSSVRLKILLKAQNENEHHDCVLYIKNLFFKFQWQLSKCIALLEDLTMFLAHLTTLHLDEMLSIKRAFLSAHIIEVDSATHSLVNS